MKQELYELTNPQKSIWLTEQYFTDTAVNTICGYTFITDAVNLEVLKKAIYEMVKSNDGMRLKINSKSDTALQYVSDFEPFYIPTVELSTKEDIEKKALEMASPPFMQPNEFLFQFLLFKLPDNSGGFIVNVHHLIGDSWSLGLIAKEVTTIYSELLTNTYEKKNYPSYLNYIESENNYKDSERYLKDKTYWEEIFKTLPEVASLQTMKEEKEEISCGGKRERFVFSSKDLTNIQSFCDKYKISVYNFFMAIYSLYISKISNLSDFVIGTPILNRTNFDQKHTMGMFISVAPLRVTLKEETSFIDFAKDISTNIMSIFRHQKYSYQTILEDIRKRDASVPNLYNILLSYQITKTTEESSQIHYSTDWVFNSCVADELQIHLFDLNDEASMTVAYDYKASLFSAQEIANLHHRILAIIEQIIAQENVLLKDITIVTPEEKHELLHDFNNTAVPYPDNKTIIDLFEEQVQKTPDVTAVEYEDIKLSYRDLDTRVNQLSHYLNSLNLTDTKNIGIFTNRTIDTIVGILSILKIGSTLVPIDPLYPEERIGHMIKTADLEFILSSSPVQGSITIPIIDIAYSNYENCEKSYTARPVQPQDNLYVIFTSGSTGMPKGLTLTHQNMVNLICFEKRSYDFLSKENKILQFATMSFDVSYQEIFSALLSGATLVLIDEMKRKNMDLLVDYIVSHHVTVLFIPPAYLRLLVEEDKNVTLLSSTVKHIITAGESLLISSGIRKLLENDIELFNHYGPAETHVATTYLVPKDMKASVAPIGFPINNSQIYILNNHNELCPINVPGQIAISGDCVGNGYMNRPDLTQEKFIQDPFIPNQTMYLTGDIGFIDENHIIHYIGRNDFQVKINGFRIEPDEITKNILQYPNITSSCTIIKEYHAKKYIVSYYTTNAKVTTEDLRSFLSQRLASYMMPYRLIELTSLPINLNGKIDKKALPDIQFEDDDNFSMPQTDTEKKLLTIWQEVLQLSKISTQSNFFHLGGDSLLAIKLIALINESFGINITINSLFKHPTICSLANYLDMSTKNKTSTISKTEEREYYPLSSAQKRIYYTANLDTNSVLYNIAGGIIVDKKLDIAKLQNCFTTLIERHDALRTHFVIKNNDVVQVIDKKVDFSLETATDAANNINNIYTNFVKPFDLSKAPLLRAKVVTLNDNKMLLLLDMHHIISDGTSLAILLQELCDLYNDVSLPDLAIDYRDFTLWEQEQFKTDKFREAKEFWVHSFQDEIPLLNMPTTYPRPSIQSFEGNTYYATLPQEVFDKINQVAQRLDITPYMLLLSVYYILLSKYTSQDDIVVGTPIVGREMAELSNVLGMFVNTLALRSKINTSSTFEEFSEMMKENCLNSFLNQIYPYDMLVKDLNVKREGGRNPLFDVMFIYQNNGYPKINFRDTHVDYFIPYGNISKFDLSLEVIPIDKEYSLRFEYCTKLFDEDFIKRLSSHYIHILNTILSNTNIKLADIQMMSQEEEKQILQEFNNTKVDYPSTKTIIDLFEEQVQKNPHKIAVVFEDQKLTYQELNEKSNQLARYLITNNASLGDVVCILLDKSLEMIISILGILKIGATFLPIDISYPNERIDYIIRNSKSSIIITNKSLIHKTNSTAQPLCIELEPLEQYENSNLDISYDVDNLAYIMYTSGSTGNPKGVAVTHQNIVRLVKNNSFITFEKEERILQTGSIVFDACTFEIWGALLNGFALYIIKKEDLLDAYLLENYIQKNKITTLWLTAPLFHQLSEVNPAMFKGVSKLLTGGDVVSPKHISQVKKACPNLTIIDGYGPTENTTFSCCFTIDQDYDTSIPIGKPISNSTAYVVSPSGLLCPIGVPGELWVGGDGVAKGYWNNEDLTKEKFIPNPFGNGMIYKTGDLVRWLPDGNIEFMGRIDNQVKIRGFRIELSEINQKIAEYPAIKETFTTITIVDEVKYICSYIVEKSPLDIDELKNYLNTYLPSYMIPTYFVKLKKLPINQNGKVDKHALPTNFEHFIDTRQVKEPTCEEEALLLSLFKKVLNNEHIGITDNFFEIGGDSLTAMKLQVEAISSGLNISYSDIFKYATVETLIQQLHTTNKSEHKEDTIDYSHYDALTVKNTLESPIICPQTDVGNVLLTGFTGFLGAHILDSFMKQEKGRIYCLIRGKNGMTARERLFNVLHFYFENKYDILVDDRIILVDGDITSPSLGLSDKEYNELGRNIRTVIHSAALVKHYGIYQEFEEINVNGTKNMVEFAKKFHTRLLHISTISVSGNNLAEGANIENHFEHEMIYDETNFYIGQNLENLYVKSKFEAEKVVFDVISEGVEACILRMGNLTSRFSEGKFQQNHFENAFVNRLKSFLQIGVFPKDLLHLYCEFTPIDYCGDAIIKIASHFNKDYTVFHLLNEKQVYLDRLFDMLTEIGIPTKLVSEEEFAATIQSILEDPDRRQLVEGIINDLSSDKKLVYQSDVVIKSDFTKEFLYKTGFEWPYIDIHYIRNYFQYLIDIGYFNISIN